MKKQSLITVYITNYNYGQFIRQAIDSVLKQTYKNYEVFVIDDGSTDNSKLILEEYSNNSKIKLVYQQNKGLIRTNNIALRLARGKYIIRLDADDYFDPNALIILASEMDNDPELGLVYPNYFIVDIDNNVTNFRERNNEDNNIVKDIPAHGACTLIRTKFLREIGGYDESFTCQDGYYLWLNFIKKYKVKNVETPLFYYRQHGNNLTENKDRIINTRNKIINKYYNQNEIIKKKALVIIPVRGARYNVNSIALKFLHGKTILQWKIDEVIKSNQIGLVIISTPDKQVINEVKNYYSTEKRVMIHERSSKLAILNIGLKETVKSIFKDIKIPKDFDIFLTLSIRYPFLKSSSIDTAINSLYLYNTDSIITVEPDNSRFFQKSNNGLKSILNQEKFTKLERDDLYRYSGGLILTKRNLFEKDEEFIVGNVGHVIIEKMESFIIQNEIDFLIAKFLLKSNVINF